MRWLLPTSDPTASDRLARDAGIPPLIASLLLARGIGNAEQAHRFLHPRLEHLHSPYDMLGLRAALDRLRQAIARKETVLIYGDYDVDGTTAIVILKTAIELCGGVTEFHVPHRIREGYGMKDDILEGAAAAGVTLIISVDTGIRAFHAGETARRLGLDLIVTDHHLPHDAGVPQALAVLNPNQGGCAYPCKALCGAGVAFKLAQALLETEGKQRLLPSFLKMVAIATIADAVPLTGENRVFAKLGLENLRTLVNPGLRALFEVAGLDPALRRLSTGDIGFRVAPRLNAAGRMDVARDVIELFTVKDAVRARDIALRLNQLNTERQEEERRILAEIDRRIVADPALAQAYCIVLDGDGWHRGVVGIAATRVVEKYGRPALVISRDGDEAHGSGRSITAFHLLDALESCAELFTRHGGHAHAVGFGLPAARLPELRARLDSYARQRLTPADFEPSLHLDGLVDLSAITPKLYETLLQLEPFGMDNPQPRFATHGARLLLPPKFIKEQHAKLRVAQDGRRNGAMDAMAWRIGERIRAEQLVAGDLLELAFTVEMNEHPDFGGLQLNLCDLRRAAAAAS